MLISEPGPGDRLVMDTHVWVWASGEAGGPERLGARALQAIELAARARRLFVSAASVWEIALKAERGQAVVSGDLQAWVRDQREYPGVRVLSLNSRVAIDCTRLPLWVRARDGKEHRDPADRFIVTTARMLQGVALTCDEEILRYADEGHVRAYDAR
jgi:PIN domain nuclease of toxin-antitoxin system